MLVTAILTTVILIPSAYTLTCLQCNSVPQPRHCTDVTECEKDEICGIEEVQDAFGDLLFNVGCLKKSKCLQSNSSNHCIKCCSSDLCNAEGCGQIGYPQNRGPVCYNCPVHTNSKFCHVLDICGVGEVCMFDVQRQFGDLVYTSKCSDFHACKQSAGVALVGRDVEGLVEPRSLTEHVCRGCCDTDLCNKACNGSTIPGPCDSSPCAHGTCHEENGDFFCVCDQGYSGKECNVSTSHCLSNPCNHGHCYDIFNDYVCVCDHGFEGKQCNTFILSCASNPCVHGKCVNINNGYICTCTKGYIGKICEKIANDCFDFLNTSITYTSGVYDIILWKSKRIVEVFCDMDTDNGGWTVFQRRVNGSVDFYRNFSEYENGFGNVAGEFWLGLANIQEMTAQGTSEFRLDLTAASGRRAYETFQSFNLGVAPGYILNIGSVHGTAGDGMSYSRGSTFATYDKDHNTCAVNDHGGWWYKNCVYANLNGEYITPGSVSNNNSGEAGVIYYRFEDNRSLKETYMMFRRH